MILLVASAILIKKKVSKKDTNKDLDELIENCPFGYFLSDDDNSECIQCSILNCGECKGTKDNIYCNKCKSEYFIPNDSINKKNC